MSKVARNGRGSKGIRAAQARGKRLGRRRWVFRRDQAFRLRLEGKSWRELPAAVIPCSACTIELTERHSGQVQEATPKT
jgi:hypothetical protein